MVPAAATDTPPTCEIRGWAVFGPGYHKGTLYTPDDVHRVAANFDRLKGHLTPRVGLGHDKEQRLAQSLGLPSAGRVAGARAGGDGTLVLDLDGVPAWLGGMVNAGRFAAGSVELNPSAPDPADPAKTIRGPVLTGIALLGEEQPAVKGHPPPVAVFADGTPVPPNADPLPVPRELAAAMSAAGRPHTTPTLCFSETTPMPTRDEMIQQLQACGLNPAQYGSLSDEQLKAVLDGLNGEQFAAAMRKKFADAQPEVGAPAGGTPAPESTPAAPDQNEALMSMVKKCLSEELDPLKQRLGSVEKAYSDKQEEERSKGEAEFAAELMSELVKPENARRVKPYRRPLFIKFGLDALREKKFGDAVCESKAQVMDEFKKLIRDLPEDPMFRDHIGPVPQKTEIASNPILGATIRKGGVLDKLAPATAKRLRESAAATN